MLIRTNVLLLTLLGDWLLTISQRKIEVCFKCTCLVLTSSGMVGSFDVSGAVKEKS